LWYHGAGGGIYCSGSSPAISNSVISGNRAAAGGGVYSATSSPTLTGCTITENEVYRDGFSSGGGLYLALSEDYSPTILDTTISWNVADGYGGGVQMYGNSGTSWSMTDCAISDNYSWEWGGGISLSGTNPVEISSCLIERNSTLGGSGEGGGGIHTGGPLTIVDSTIAENTAINHNGGGIFVGTSPTTITRCEFLGNIALDRGGGIWLGNGPATITNCNFLGNASGDGAGLYCVGPSPNVSVVHCTFSGNTATYSGGAIASLYGASPTLSNSILWGNSAGYEGQEISVGTSLEIRGGLRARTAYEVWESLLALLAEPSTTTVSHSDIQGGESSVFVCDVCTLNWLPGNIDSDPLFIGGGDHHLQPASPCIDQGSDAGVSEDIDGDIRPLLAGFDIGSDEYSAACWDLDEDGYPDQRCGGTDCDDSNFYVNPGQTEVPNNGIDDDCDPLTPDVPSTPWGAANIPESSTIGSIDLKHSGLFNVMGILLLPFGWIAAMRRKRKYDIA
jgi:predicted outer membrane repeat protein